MSFRVKGLLCDLDGTLIDSIPCLYTIFEKLLGTIGIQATKKEFLELIGFSTHELFEYLEKKYNLSKIAIQEFYQHQFETSYLQDVNWFPMSLETLKKCDDNGIKIGLVTSMQRSFLQNLLAIKEVEHYFEVIVAGGDTRYSKPYPDPFEAGIKQMGIDLDLILGIEDSHPGLLSGKRAGIKMLQFCPYQTIDPLADYTFTSWEAFPLWILAH